MLKMKNISDKRAAAQSRAAMIQKLTEAYPALEDAIRSRSNRDFRAACIAIIRDAKTDENAAARADIIGIENLSAFNQFCAECFEGIGEGSQKAAPLDLSRLGL